MSTSLRTSRRTMLVACSVVSFPVTSSSRALRIGSRIFLFDTVETFFELFISLSESLLQFLQRCPTLSNF